MKHVVLTKPKVITMASHVSNARPVQVKDNVLLLIGI